MDADKFLPDWSFLTSRLSQSISDPGNSDQLSDDEYPVIEEMQNFSVVQDRGYEPSRDISLDKTRTPSPSKMKLPFFEGFRNTFRGRARSEDVDLVQTLNISRRWSETQTNHVDSAAWSAACVVSDCQAVEAGQLSLRRGERVRILKHSKANGFFVQKLRNSTQTARAPTLEEGWVPAHCIAISTMANSSNGTSKKPWSFKFRKPSFNSGTAGILRRKVDRLSLDNTDPSEFDDLICSNSGNRESPQSEIEILCKLVDSTVQVGDFVELKCQIRTPSHIDLRNVNIIWRRSSEKDSGFSSCLVKGDRYSISFSDRGIASLTISDCISSDSGLYSCTVSSNNTPNSSVTTSAHLTIIAHSVGRPRAQALSPSSALIVWDGEPAARYTLHYQMLDPDCQTQPDVWVNTTENTHSVLGLSHCVDGLVPGGTYVFRVSNGLPSSPLSLPSPSQTNDYNTSRWQQEQFGRRYLEKEVLGRGRYSVVKKAQDRGTGQLVAAKQVFRMRQTSNITQSEYSILLRLQHQSVVRAFALFESSPLPTIDTIIMELVSGPVLLSYVCQEGSILEKTVRDYMQQLFSALDYLHNKNIVHFDIRPDNILVDLTGSNPSLKLVDLGGSVHHEHSHEIAPPASLEFAAPECVLGQPAGPPCDLWGAAVFLYLFLSGLSPFLDESIEETTANVLKCDYSFPDEFFGIISSDAKLLISKILLNQPNQRLSAHDACNTSWFHKDTILDCRIPTSRLSLYVNRRQSSSQIV
ncbi:Kalirin [Frankliniella fusca]|uniref:Kalirin n=1 Tax=Frankliniella fusca TaxID=407009 RepID=A0AAE1LVG4_9NEOP|nr:Kalirin [Frankliniella fusca]